MNIRFVMVNILSRDLRYKFEVYFKKIILDCPVGKMKYYPISLEFQERNSLHIYSCICIFNAPNIQKESAYIDFIKPFETYQVHVHSITGRKKYKMNVCSVMVNILSRKLLLQNQSILNLATMKTRGLNMVYYEYITNTGHKLYW